MPVRLLKPGLIDSPRWNSCEWDTQVLYVRLLSLVDDYGRYHADPRLIRGHGFALRPDVNELRVENMCRQLSECGLAIFYKHDGKAFLQLTGWDEKARSRSKFPDPADPKSSRLQTIDRNCLQMITSPPSPSPSPSPPPAVSKCLQTDTEPPPGFPKTETEAMEIADFVGSTKEFAALIWNKAASRGWCDAKGVSIASFRHHLKIEWNYEQERKQRNENSRPSFKQAPNRNEGTNNDSSQYANLQYKPKQPAA